MVKEKAPSLKQVKQMTKNIQDCRDIVSWLNKQKL